MTMIKISKEDGLATIVLNRPEKRNALNRQMVAELTDAIQVLSEDAATRVVMLRGEGEHFCAGADIALMEEMSNASFTNNVEEARKLAALMYSLHACVKPTLVLAQGATFGGGLGLLAACDMALAARSAIFGFSEVKLGVVPAVISPYILAAMGERAARYYFLTGASFGVEKALQHGLIMEVCDDQMLQSAGEKMAQTLLSYSPSAVTAVKVLIQEVSGQAITPALSERTAHRLAAIRATPEAKQAMRAFLEKKSKE
ncbi:MAG: hypothetical protein A3J38_03860 [Gammaproteobacteria bacterium RIFCSPHIGHO2_12_FULL_45_9]|nr:MAG: hypothetical protein A3J38_03860 [Gammaproteobacteria bacterium RIFCSPHIGHO2_12_FULL_45_9]